MSESLATYLEDHLAGSKGAIDLLNVMCERHEGEPLGRFAVDLIREVKEDRDVLKGLAARVGAGSSVLKEAGAWIGEKASRAKFRHREADAFGTFMALETLSLGILGKRALWKALATLAVDDDRLQGIDFDGLIQRARSQHAVTQNHRLQHVHLAFGGK